MNNAFRVTNSHTHTHPRPSLSCKKQGGHEKAMPLPSQQNASLFHSQGLRESDSLTPEHPTLSQMGTMSAQISFIGPRSLCTRLSFLLLEQNQSWVDRRHGMKLEPGKAPTECSNSVLDQLEHLLPLAFSYSLHVPL